MVCQQGHPPGFPHHRQYLGDLSLSLSLSELAWGAGREGVTRGTCPKTRQQYQRNPVLGLHHPTAPETGLVHDICDL